MYEHAPIENARMLLQQCIELIAEEPQQSFFLMRLSTDLEAVKAALDAVQTVVIAPLADGIDANILTPPPIRDEATIHKAMHNVEAVYAGNPPQNLADIDDGEPSAYEVDRAYGTTIIK